MVREQEILIFYNQNSTDRSKWGGGSEESTIRMLLRKKQHIPPETS